MSGEQRDGPRLRVLCVDDNAMLTAAFGRRVERDPGFEWVGAFNDGVDLANRVRKAGPDVVLLDVDMPGVDAFDLLSRLSESAPTIRVAMLSGHLDPAYIDRALDCGAWGYLSKSEDVRVLLDDVRRIGGGEIVFSNEVEAARRSAGSTLRSAESGGTRGAARDPAVASKSRTDA